MIPNLFVRRIVGLVVVLLSLTDGGLPPDTTTFEEVLPTIRAVGKVSLSQMSPKITISKEPEPHVEQVHPDEGPIYGNVAVSILGSGFGKMDLGQVARIGDLPCLRTSWISDTELRCVLPPGMGANKPVSVDVLGATSKETSCLFTYRDEGPFVDRVEPGQGGADMEISIFGVNLGAPELNPTAFVGGRSCTATKWVSSREIRCLVPPGHGKKLNVSVVIAGLRADTKGKFSYFEPQVHEIKPCVGPTYGNLTVDIIGQGLGTPLTKPLVTVGGIECMSVEVSNPSRIRCTIPPGMPGNAKVKISLNGRTVPGCPDFTYEPPVIESISPPFASLFGGDEIVISGRNFGFETCTSCVLPKVLVGGFMCENVKLISSTEIRCEVPPATQAGHVPLVVVVQDHSSDECACGKKKCPHCFEFRAPVVRSVAPMRGATFGGYALTIGGDYFGQSQLDQEIFVGDLKCENTRWLSSSELVCESVPSSKKGEVRVDVGSSITSPSHLCSKLSKCDRGHDFTYEPPEILRLSPSRGSTLGGTVVLISGKNVGGSGETRVSFVKTAEQKCSGESIEEMEVKDIEECEQKCRDSDSCSVFSFSVARSMCRLHSKPASSSSNKAVSSRECFLKHEESISVKIGGFECTQVTRISETEIECTTPKGPLGLATPVVSIQGEESQGCDTNCDKVPKFLYDGPFVNSIIPCEGSFEGGYKVTISGSDFGSRKDTRVVSFDGLECLETKFLSSNRVECVVPPAKSSGEVHVVVSVNGAPSTMQNEEMSFRYLGPQIKRVSPRTVGVSGGDLITVYGKNFGSSNAVGDLEISVDGLSCTDATRISDIEATCKTPTSLRSGIVPVVLSAGTESSEEVSRDCLTSKQSSGCAVVEYVPPTIEKIVPQAGPVYGSQRVTIQGRYLAMPKTSIRPIVTFGGHRCTSIEIVSANQISCLTPEVEKPGAFAAVVSVGSESSAPYSHYNFESPQIHRLHPAQIPSSGNVVITITGKHFEKESLVHVGNSPCGNVTFKDDKIMCVAPEHEAGKAPITIAVRGHKNRGAILSESSLKASQNRACLMYLGPIVLSLTPDHGPWSGGEKLRIFGEGFGNREKDIRVSIGGTDCKNVHLKSQKIMECETQPSQTGEQDVRVFVNGVSSEESVVKYTYEAPILDTISPAFAPSYGGSTIQIFARNIRGPDLSRVSPQVARLRSARNALNEALRKGDMRGVEGAKREIELAKEAKLKEGAPDFARVDVLVDGIPCLKTNLKSDTIIECVTPPQRRKDDGDEEAIDTEKGSHVDVTLVVGAVKSEKALELAYVPPSIASVSPSTGPVDGGQTIDIFGNFLGAEKLKPHIFVDNLPCAKSEYVSASQARCIGVPALQSSSKCKEKCDTYPAELKVFVDVADPAFNPKTTSPAVSSIVYVFERPSVEKSSPETVPWYGESDIVLTGTNLKPADDSTKIRLELGGRACRETKVLTANRVQCIGVPAEPQNEAGNEHKWSVVVISQDDVENSYESKLTMKYEQPEILSIEPSTGATFGGIQVKVRGKALLPPSRLLLEGTPKSVMFIGDNAAFEIDEIQENLDSKELVLTGVTPPSTKGAIDVEVSALLPGMGTFAKGSERHVKSSKKLFRYCGPKLDSIFPKNSPMYGGARVELRGECLGDVHGKALTTVSVGGVKCTDVDIVSEQKVTCTIPASTRGPGPAKVSIVSGGASSSESVSLNYLAPVVESVLPHRVPFYGETLLTIAGQYLGSKDEHVPVVTLNGAVCADVKVLQNGTHLTCISPPNAVGDSTLVVNILDATNQKCGQILPPKHPACLRFEAPMVYKIQPSKGPVHGGATIMVEGKFLGKKGMKTDVLIGNVPCEKTVRVSESWLRCEGTPPQSSDDDDSSDVTIAVESRGKLRMNEGSVALNGSVLYGFTPKGREFSFECSKIKNLIPADGDVIGHETITIITDRLQEELFPSIGGVPCLSSKRINDTATECVIPPYPCTSPKCAQGVDLEPSAVSLGPNCEPQNDVSSRFKYHAIAIRNLLPSEGPMYGGTKLQIEGAFGRLRQVAEQNEAFMPVVTVGDLSCVDVIFVDDRKDLIECVLPPMSTTSSSSCDTTRDVTISVGTIQTNSMPFTYLAPSPELVSPSVPTYGGTEITVKGKHLCLQDEIPVIYVGNRVCEDPKRVSDEELRCIAPPNEEGEHPVVVHVGHYNNCKDSSKKSSTNVATVTYEPPEIEKISPVSGSSCGRTPVEITGRRFGRSVEDVVVLFGTIPCTLNAKLEKIEDGRQVFSCVTPSAPVFEEDSNTMSVDVTVAVGAQASRIRDAYIYRALRLDRVTPSTGVAAGGTSVEIQGRGFPENPSSDKDDPRRLRVTFDGRECTQLERVSDTMLKCLTPSGAGKPRIHVHAHGRHSRLDAETSYFKYDAPVVSNVESPEGQCPVSGCEITIKGKNFGPKEYAADVLVDEGTCLKTKRVSDTTLVCKTPPGLPGKVQVEVEVSGQTSESEDAVVHFDAPVVKSVEAKSMPTAGNARITIKGSSLCVPHSEFSLVVKHQEQQEIDTLQRRSRLVEKLDRQIHNWSKDRVSIATAMELASQRITEHLRDMATKERSYESSESTEELLQPQLRRLANIIETIEEKHKHHVTQMRETSMEISEDTKEREKKILENSKTRSEKIREARAEAVATKSRLAAQMQGTLAAEIAVGKRAVSDAEEATKALREKQRKGIKDDVFNQVRRLGEIADELRKHTHAMRSDAARRRIKEEEASSFLETNEGTNVRRRRRQQQRRRHLVENKNIPCGEGGREDCAEDAVETPEIVKKISSTVTTTTTTKHELPDRHVDVSGEMSTPMVTVNNEACNHVQCLSSSSLRCTLPAGFGTKNKIVVELGDKKSEAKAILDYDAPEIDHIVPVTAPTATSTLITILGKNFGCSSVILPKIKVMVGDYECENAKRHCDNEITCTLPSGTGGNLPVSLEIDGRSSTKQHEFSYDAPTICGVEPSVLETRGGTEISICGTNMGPEAKPGSKKPKPPKEIVVRVGDAECTDIVLHSSTELTCKAPAGVGTNLAVTIEIDGLKSDKSTTSVSYLPPKILSIKPKVAATGDEITLNGLHFGKDNSELEVDFNGESSSDECKIVNDETITCKVPPGVGAFVPISVRVAKQSNTVVSNAFSYALPEVEIVDPSENVKEGSKITISGQNFGPKKHDQSITLGKTKCLNTEYVSSTKLVCVVPPGVGVKREVKVTVARQTSTKNGEFTFEAPHINSISPSNAPALGGSEITIKGTGFGPKMMMSSSGSSLIDAKIGTQKCAETKWLSHHEISCVLPAGLGADLSVSLQVANQNSNSNIKFSYDKPEVNSAGRKDGPTQLRTVGGDEIVIRGANFGPAENKDVSVYIGDAPCNEPAVVTDSEIHCVAPSGAGRDVKITVRAGGQISEETPIVRFLRPVVSTVIPKHASPGDEITVKGSGFGAENTAPLVTLGGHPCTSTSWVNDTIVLCDVPQGVGTGRKISVAVAGQVSEPLEIFDYDAPKIFEVEPNIVPTHGVVEVTVHGSNFGTADNDHVLIFGGSRCPPSFVTFVSSEELRCSKVPQIFGVVDVQVVLGGQTGTGKEILSSDLPVVKRLLTNGHGPGIGGNKITMEVENVPFSPVPAGIEIKVTIGGNECTNLKVSTVRETEKDFNQIECIAPPGGGSQNHVVVTVAGQSSVDPVFHAYYAPTVTRVEPETSAISGGTHVTVFGSNFGPYDGVKRQDGSVEELNILIGTDTGTVPCKEIIRLGEDDPHIADSQVVCVTDANERSACRSVVASLSEQTSTPKDILSFRDEPLVVQEADVTLFADFRVSGFKDRVLLVLCPTGEEGCYASELLASFQCTDPQLQIFVVYDRDLLNLVESEINTCKNQNDVMLIYGPNYMHLDSSNREDGDTESDIENWVRKSLKHPNSIREFKGEIEK